MNIKKTKKIEKVDFFAYGLCILFTIASIAVSLNRFWQYDVFYYDFGIFDQAIWNVAHFKAPIIDHLVVGRKWIFADHFSPSIFLFSPLYWFTDKSEVLLILQSLTVGLSGVVLYLIGIKLLKKKFLSLSVVTSYLLFVGLQNAIIADFHEVTVSTLFLMLTFWAIITNKKLLYFIFLLITLGFKESLFMVGVGIGIYIFTTKKDWRKISLATFVISALWGYVAIKLVIPYFSGGLYQYMPSFSTFGNPLTLFFDEAVKRRTMYYSFLSFGFLPVLSPQFWLLILQDFSSRFVPNAHTRWDLGLHYNAQSAVFFALSSFYGLRFLNNFKLVKKHISIIGILLIANAFFLYRFILHAPLGLFYNTAFYRHTNDFAFLNNLVSKVPKNTFVMTQNNLAVRFTHQKVVLLHYFYSLDNPDYIVFDKRKGQDPNDFFTTSDINGIYDKLMKDDSYKIVFNTSDQYVFKRITGM